MRDDGTDLRIKNGGGILLAPFEQERTNKFYVLVVEKCELYLW